MSSKKSKSKKSKKDKKPSDPSMDELLEKYGKDEPPIGLSRGDRVKGKVIAKEPGRVTIDIGGKSEGLVAEKAYKEAEDYIKDLEVGDEVEARVIIPEGNEGYTILSFREAAANAAWKQIEEAEDKGKQIVVYGKGTNSSGVMVDVNGLTGFIPNSQLGSEASENRESLVGKHFKVEALTVDRDENKIVLSEKAVSEAEDVELARQALEKVKAGDEFKGEVTTIYDFGCFVEIKVPLETKRKGKSKKKEKIPIEGLVHISELAWEKVDEPEEVVSEGGKVDVKVIGKRDGKLALSMKQTTKDPWEGVEKKYKKDKRLEGEVMKVTDFGAFVQLEPGVEGLIHMTKIPPGKKLEEDDEVKVYVEEVDEKNRKISLGLVLTAKPVGYR